MSPFIWKCLQKLEKWTVTRYHYYFCYFISRDRCPKRSRTLPWAQTQQAVIQITWSELWGISPLSAKAEPWDMPTLEGWRKKTSQQRTLW